MRAELGELRSPVVLVAFGGWNDAADAATDLLAHLVDRYPAQPVGELTGDEYYDYQETRPMIQLRNAGYKISWPKVSMTKVSLPDRDLILLEGPEPNLRWRTFVGELVGMIAPVRADAVVLLGAMLSDAPHSRPLPLTGSASDSGLAEVLGLEPNNYEGPTGILGVLADALAVAGQPVVSLWTAVPHYVSNAPCPKATLVLLNGLEGVLRAPLDLGALPERALEWGQRVDELTAEDVDIAEYVASLETISDQFDAADGSGDEIAAAFEAYLQQNRSEES